MMLELGGRLKELRASKCLTQKQLADKVGLTKSVISAYECGIRYPSLDMVVSLARVFGVTTDYLLYSKSSITLDVSKLSKSNLQIISTLVDTLAER